MTHDARFGPKGQGPEPLPTSIEDTYNSACENVARRGNAEVVRERIDKRIEQIARIIEPDAFSTPTVDYWQADRQELRQDALARARDIAALPQVHENVALDTLEKQFRLTAKQLAEIGTAKEQAEAERDATIARARILDGMWVHAEAECERLTAALAAARVALTNPRTPSLTVRIAHALEAIDSALSHPTTEPAKAEEKPGER